MLQTGKWICLGFCEIQQVVWLHVGYPAAGDGKDLLQGEGRKF